MGALLGRNLFELDLLATATPENTYPPDDVGL
jgi:hypothetical protein